MNDWVYMYGKFQSHSYWQSLVIYSCLNLYNFPYTNVRFLPVCASNSLTDEILGDLGRPAAYEGSTLASSLDPPLI